MREAERNADQRDHQDADQRAAHDAPVVERRDQHEAEQHEHRLPVPQVAQGHQRRRMRDHDLGFLERDDAEEQADAGRDRELQVVRDRIDDVLPDAEHRDQKEDHARAEHRRQRLLPAVFVGQHHGEGEEGVDAHAGRERDRIIGVQRHHHRAHRRRHAGGDEHRAGVHAGLAEDRWVDEDDVDHRQERGQAGDEFGADVGALRLEAEIALQRRRGRRIAAGFFAPFCCPLGHFDPPSLPKRKPNAPFRCASGQLWTSGYAGWPGRAADKRVAHRLPMFKGWNYDRPARPLGDRLWTLILFCLADCNSPSPSYSTSSSRPSRSGCRPTSPRSAPSGCAQATSAITG